jgi:transketolase
VIAGKRALTTLRRPTAWPLARDLRPVRMCGAPRRPLGLQLGRTPVFRRPGQEDAVNDAGRQPDRGRLDTEQLTRIAARMRWLILSATARAGSGHPTSSLSAVELMSGLCFGGFFRYRVDDPGHPNNDRLIFSKGHASPLFYALWAAAGAVSEDEMMTYRVFGSPLEGHPSTAFPYTEAATGSLGQGLSIGLGMALNAKYLDRLPYRTWVLLGDSEMAEGSQWEAMELAAYYGLDNLVGVIDVNRLGQRGETMYGYDLEAYRRRVEAFGWRALVVEDGHSFEEIAAAYRSATEAAGRPTMVIAHTVKGKGAPAAEDKNGYHGKALEGEDLEQALAGLGEVDHKVRGAMLQPEDRRPGRPTSDGDDRAPDYERGAKVATRNAYGNALVRIADRFPDLVALDGEVSNSTRAEFFQEARPERFFEMYIAEQNMAGAAVGLAMRGKVPFVSSFAAFLTRAFDQIRMSQYSEPNLKFVGSHAGVSIGQDGPSQMGLEDLAMFRSVRDAVVLYPSDAVSCERLVERAAGHKGIVYLRTTRGGTPVIYSAEDQFTIAGSKVLGASDEDRAAVVAAGITLHEALAAQEELAGKGIRVRVIDLYSVQPLDRETLQAAARDTGAIVTVEDHHAAGGIGEAVAGALAGTPMRFTSLAVRRKPRSGKPQELLAMEGIDRKAIVDAVEAIV